MLTDESFKGHLNIIFQALPKQRQTLMFSATMVKDYDKFITKEDIFGTKEASESVIECSNTADADETFQMTVRNLD